MDRKAILDIIDREIRTLSQGRLNSIDAEPVGGGSINLTWRITARPAENYFLKVNAAQNFPQMFRKERVGLEVLARTGSIRVPEVLLVTEESGLQFLLLEWVEEGRRTPAFWKRFGEQLARLHRHTNDQFGFAEDNYMGSLPQRNTWHQDWPGFFEACRLRPQVDLALRNGLLDTGMAAQFEKLYGLLGSIFEPEPPSLLHGDLWGGNFICDQREQPVLIDPAIYYGHRSMDLAMTKLFGGFYKDFYQSYEYHFPLPPNHGAQWEICNLYPLLVHLNLFGTSYLGGIADVLKKYT